MARSHSSDEEKDRLEAERASIVCRLCGNAACHFPPPGADQKNALCSACFQAAPTAQTVIELTKKDPSPAVDYYNPRTRSRKFDIGDYTKEIDP